VSLIDHDLFWNGVYPFIDDGRGGGIDGMIRADDAILAQLDNDVVLVPASSTKA
jgi:hypothetical protein